MPPVTGESISIAEYKALISKGKQGGRQVDQGGAPKKQARVKGYKRTVSSGRAYDSKREAIHGEMLILSEKRGFIKDLIFQPKFPFKKKGLDVLTPTGRTRYYRADFSFIEVKTGKYIVQDVKGMRTQLYELKRDLVKAIYGIEIEEV